MKSSFELTLGECGNPRIQTLRFSDESVQNFAVSSSTIPLLFSRREKCQQQLREIFASCFGESCSNAIRAVLGDRSQGAIICPSLESDLDVLERLLIGVAASVGQPYSAPNHSRCVVENVLRDLPEKAQSLLRRSPYRVDPLHTDGHGSDEVPEQFIALACTHRKKCIGGESVLLHIDDWEDMDRLSLQVGSQQFYFDFPGGSQGTSQTVQRPIFFDGPGGKRMSFLSGYLRRTIDSQEPVAEIESSLARAMGSASAQQFSLEERSFYLIDNGFWLHGRMPLEKKANMYRRLICLRGSYK